MYFLHAYKLTLGGGLVLLIFSILFVALMVLLDIAMIKGWIR